MTSLRSQPQALVALVSRLMLAQAAVTATVGLAYLRRNLTWLLFVLMLAVALGLLASLVRSGSHAAWVTAVTGEAVFTLLGLVRVASVQYLGGTLLAMATLGVLVHPAVGRAFATARRSESGLADNPGGAG